MLTHFFKSINWVDVGLAVLFIRLIFIGVKDGFIAELCRSFGTIIALFVCLHWYSYIAAIISVKTHLAVSPLLVDFIVFVLLWALVIVVMKFVREGLMMLFRVETTHKGFDQYAAGILAVGRGILVCSLSIVLLLMVNSEHLRRMTFKSVSFKIAGRAAVMTYGVLYHNIVGKIFSQQHYNESLNNLYNVAQ